MVSVVIAAVGISGSGKTTTLEFLISNLTKEGYAIGTIKHIHRENFTIDKEGSNTWRFSKAGSKVTVAFSPEEIAIIQNKKTSYDDLDNVIQQLRNEQLDIIFIEGFHGYISKRQEMLKIVTAKNTEDLEVTLNNTVPPVLAISGLVVLEENQPIRGTIPYIKIPSEGQKLIEIIKKHLKPSQDR